MQAISILACPKSFIGTAAAIQRTALATWQQISAPVEIILYGDSPGVAEVAAEHGVKHVPAVETAVSGVPLFSAIARHAAAEARYDWQIYLNADIILPPDLVSRLQPAANRSCMITGERMDLTQGTAWKVEADWHGQLNRLWEQGAAQPHGPTGMDYFVFPRGLWSELKTLPLGRGGYDNALLAYCLRRGVPIVDATAVLPVVHQWHDYSQLAGGMTAVHQGDEARGLQALHDIQHSAPSVADSDWIMSDRGLQQVACRGDRLRALEIALRYRRGWKYLSYAVRVAWRLRSRLAGNPAGISWIKPRTGAFPASRS